MTKKSLHLYSPAEVKKVRESLLKEQKGKDALTHLDIPQGQAVLDHNHKTQFVRGVLHRQSNAVLGKIENLWTRYLSYWYSGTLSDFLRKTADYIERKDDHRYLHPGWIKKVQTEFNKLKAKEQDRVLLSLGETEGKNPLERKKKMQKLILTKKFTFDTLMASINNAKE